jgi:hypothetical protein
MKKLLIGIEITVAMLTIGACSMGVDAEVRIFTLNVLVWAAVLLHATFIMKKTLC